MYTCSGLAAPTVANAASGAVLISWAPPATPNGPPPQYTLERVAVSAGLYVLQYVRLTVLGFYSELLPDALVPVSVSFAGLAFGLRTAQSKGLAVLLWLEWASMRVRRSRVRRRPMRSALLWAPRWTQTRPALWTAA